MAEIQVTAITAESLGKDLPDLCWPVQNFLERAKLKRDGLKRATTEETLRLVQNTAGSPVFRAYIARREGKDKIMGYVLAGVSSNFFGLEMMICQAWVRQGQSREVAAKLFDALQTWAHELAGAGLFVGQIAAELHESDVQAVERKYGFKPIAVRMVKEIEWPPEEEEPAQAEEVA